MAATNTIAEFLAKVGFKADEASLRSALTKVAAFGVGITAVAGGIVAGMLRVAHSQAEIGREAERLRIPVERLEELNYMAGQCEAGAGAVAKSLEGIAAKNPRIKDTAKALEMAGQRMRGMSRAQRELYADRMGIDRSLIPMLTKDVSALKAEYQAMYKVAGTDAKQAADQSRGLLLELDKLRTMGGLLARSLSLSLMGNARTAVESLRRAIMDNFDKIRRILDSVITLIMRLAGGIARGFERIIKWVSSLLSWYDKLDDGQKRLVLGAAALLAAWKLLNMGFLATPLGALITGLTAILALIDDYQTYMEGGESYFDWGPWEESIEGVRAVITDTAKAVGKFVSEHEDIIKSVGKAVGLFIVGRGALSLLAGTFLTASGAVSKLWGVVSANPWMMLIKLIILAAVLIYENWEPIKAFFADLWGDIQARFPNFAAMLSDAAEAVELFGRWFVAFFSGNFDEAGQLAIKMLGKLWGALSSGLKGWGNFLRQWCGDWGGIVADLIDGIVEHFRLLGRFVAAIFEGDFSGAADIAVDIFLNLVRTAGNIFAGLGRIIAGIFGWAWGKIKESFPNFAGWAEDAARSISNIFGRVFDWLRGKISGLLDYLPDAVKDMLGLGGKDNPEDDKPNPGDKGDKGDKPERPGGGPSPDDIAAGGQRMAAGREAVGQMAAGLAQPLTKLGDMLSGLPDAMAGFKDFASLAASQALVVPTGPALVPSAAARQDMASKTSNIKVESKTEIKVEGSQSPEAVGNQVAERQTRINNDLARHLQGAAS